MNKETLDKGNKLQANIDFLQKKSDALYQACSELTKKKSKAVTEEEMITFVRQLLESFEGRSAITDFVKYITDEYKRMIKEYDKEFEEL